MKKKLRACSTWTVVFAEVKRRITDLSARYTVIYEPVVILVNSTNALLRETDENMKMDIIRLLNINETNDEHNDNF